MYWIWYIILFCIYCVIPLPIQVILLVVDIFRSGIGLDTVALVVGIVLGLYVKHSD